MHATTSAPRRVLSIDVLRGLTIALMILVNDPGDWAHVYEQLDHATWNGFTLTDFVFPNFLFLVGISIVLSFNARAARGNCRLTLTGHVFRRAATIFAIKMFLTAYPHFHLSHLRIFGVLTRIALCYLAAALLCLAVWKSRHRVAILAAITAALLIGYWALMRFVPVPGFGVPTHAMPMLDPERNLAAWLDRAFNAFTQHWLHTGVLYNHTHDPEGLLSTLPAIATTLMGCITGLWLQRVDTNRQPVRNQLRQLSRHSERSSESPHLSFAPSSITRTYFINGLVISGLVSLVLGVVWNPWFPINKNLWTSSYVLFAAGWSLLLLALCYWLIDVRGLNDHPAGKWLIWPWLVFGSNAITAFVLSNFIVETMLWIKLPAGALVAPANPATPLTSWLWTYRYLFARHASTNATSLAFAIAFTAICFIPNWLLWRRKIFLRI